jgi:TonB-dependent receptor
MPLRARLVACCALGLSLLASRLAAADTGTIAGRVLNPATGEYVRNAEVTARNPLDRLGAGGAHVAVTDDNGSFTLAHVPAGEVTVEVSFTGYQKTSATVAVAAGQTARRDFELTGSLAGGRAEVVKLDAFTVSSEREGNAKAIMDQRNSMNITNSVASDVFGDNAEGNVGDFLRYMPGIDLELNQGEVRNVRLRGLPSEYNSVTIDGVSLASADANQGAAGNARAFSFEQVSLSSMDSIEVSKTISADVDANAPAGTINLKTKRAFSRAGRRITAQANLMAFADEWRFGRTPGPDDKSHFKIRAGGILEYSDVFFGKRLGVVASLAESNYYSENARSNVTYNYITPTAADPRPAVPTSIGLLFAPRTTRRSTGTLTTDFRATPNLIVSLVLAYNYSALNTQQRTTTFSAGTRANIVSGADPLLGFTAAPNGSVSVSTNGVVKNGQAITAIPSFEYKAGALKLEAKFAFSDSTSWYNPLVRRGSVNSAGTLALANTRFTAQRSSLIDSDWRLVQTTGPDWSSGAGYSMPVVRVNDGRYGRTNVSSGELVATYNTTRLVPIVWKAGVKQKDEIRVFKNQQGLNNYTYIGPGAGTGAWQNLRSAQRFDPDALGAVITSLSGGTVFYHDSAAIADLYQRHPEYFTRTLSAANFYDATVGNEKYYTESIRSGFAMGTANVGRFLLRAGLRYEDTGTEAKEPNPRTAAEVRAAGFQETNGRATTVAGLQYQYFSKPKLTRAGGYDNWFPSASVKYKFQRNFDLHFGYSSTIRRPTIRDVAGVWDINDDALVVAAPNPNLRPETSDNFAARLAYYFEPVGILALNAFQNDVQGLHRAQQQTAQEFGYTGTELAGYLFNTTVSSPEKVRIRGLEFEYSQSLAFLPKLFRGLNVRAAYTRSYSDVVLPGMSPHGASAGLNYTLGRVNVYANSHWRDLLPNNVAGTSVIRQRATLDVGGGLKFSRRYSFFFSGRNIFSHPVITMQKSGTNPWVATTVEVTGAVWTFGVKGVW